MCGVSIIDEWHVITAAHCVDDSSDFAGIHRDKVNNMRITFGTKNISNGSGRKSGVAGIYEHYNFVRANLVNDIALIKLKSPLTFNTKDRILIYSNSITKLLLTF